MLTTGPHTVLGQVFDPYSGAIGSATIDLWIETDRGGSKVLLISDANGQFTITDLGDSRIILWAGKDGFRQPCAVTPEVRGNLVLQVELTSLSTLNSLSPPRPQTAGEIPTIGLIFETANGGMQPIGGAEIWATDVNELVLATTQSDLRGRYFLCNLPPNSYLYAEKPGFVAKWVGPIDSSQAAPVDIELQRR